MTRSKLPDQGATGDAPGVQGVTLSFGPFRLFPAARAFEKDGVPLVLGNRALDILMVLVERAGEVVSHRELISRVWRGLVVDPGNLRVHMTSLRKVLGDQYIANVTGQGYCFVAPVRREAVSDASALLPGIERTPPHRDWSCRPCSPAWSAATKRCAPSRRTCSPNVS